MDQRGEKQRMATHTGGPLSASIEGETGFPPAVSSLLDDRSDVLWEALSWLAADRNVVNGFFFVDSHTSDRNSTASSAALRKAVVCSPAGDGELGGAGTSSVAWKEQECWS